MKTFLLALTLAVFLVGCNASQNEQAVRLTKEDVSDSGVSVEDLLGKLAGVAGDVKWAERAAEGYPGHVRMVTAKVLRPRAKVAQEVELTWLVNLNTKQTQLQSTSIDGRSRPVHEFALILPLLLLDGQASLAAAPSSDHAPLPELHLGATDMTGTLSPEQLDTLDSELGHLAINTGYKTAVLLVPTAGGEPIEQYTAQAITAWQAGDERKLLIAVFKDDKTLRIEVGREMSSVVPDAFARAVIDEGIVPHLRQNDFYGGLRAGLDRIEARIDAEQAKPQPRRSRELPNSGAKDVHELPGAVRS